MRAKGGKYSYLAKNTLLLTMASFGSKILSFILVPLYTNVLSTSEYGIADIITTSVTILIYVLTLNIGTGVLRFSLEEGQSPDEVLKYGIRIHIISIMIMSVGCSICCFFKVFAIDSLFYPIIVFIFASESVLSMMGQYLRGTNNVKTMAISSLIETGIRLLCNIVMLIYLDLGLVGYLLSLAVGPLVAIIYSIFAAKPKISNLFRDNENEKILHDKMRHYSVPMIANQLGWWINNSIDKYFVVYIKGQAINGVYAISYKIPSIMSMLCNIFSQAWGISAIKDYDRNDEDGFFSHTYEGLNAVLCVTSSIIILMNIPISHLFFGNEFIVAWKYSSILIIAMLFSGLSSFFTGIFNAVKNNKLLASTTIISAIINIVLNALLIPRFGAMGAAIATLISFYCVWIMRAILSKKYINLRINYLKDNLIYILLLMQVILEHTTRHCYWGQVIILALIVGCFRNSIVIFVKKIVVKIKKKM